MLLPSGGLAVDAGDEGVDVLVVVFVGLELDPVELLLELGHVAVALELLLVLDLRVEQLPVHLLLDPLLAAHRRLHLLVLAYQSSKHVPLRRLDLLLEVPLLFLVGDLPFDLVEGVLRDMGPGGLSGLVPLGRELLRLLDLEPLPLTLQPGLLLLRIRYIRLIPIEFPFHVFFELGELRFVGLFPRLLAQRIVLHHALVLELLLRLQVGVQLPQLAPRFHLVPQLRRVLLLLLALSLRVLGLFRMRITNDLLRLQLVLHALEPLFLGGLLHLALVDEVEVVLEGLLLLAHDLLQRLLLLHLPPHLEPLAVPVAPLKLPHPVLRLNIRCQLLEVLALFVGFLLGEELLLALVDLDLVLDDGAPLVDLPCKL